MPIRSLQLMISQENKVHVLAVSLKNISKLTIAIENHSRTIVVPIGMQ
jgi:hypothetical protein